MVFLKTTLDHLVNLQSIVVLLTLTDKISAASLTLYKGKRSVRFVQKCLYSGSSAVRFIANYGVFVGRMFSSIGRSAFLLFAVSVFLLTI